MKQMLQQAKPWLLVALGLLLRGASGAKLKTLDDLVSHGMTETLSEMSAATNAAGDFEYYPSEEDIQEVLRQARPGGDGLSRIEVTRIRTKDPRTGNEFDDVYVNETWEGLEHNDICQLPGDRFTPSASVLQTAKRVASSKYGALMATAMAAYVHIADYFGAELYHMGAKVGAPEPEEPAHAEHLVQVSREWSEELNMLIAMEGGTPCPNAPEWLLFCMKKTTCFLEKAVENNSHVFTPGRLTTYLEVEKEVQDHFQEFAILANMGLPHVPQECEGEVASIHAPTSLMQLKAESGQGSQRRNQAVEAVIHMQRATARTVLALSDHSRLEQLEASFFTHTWKKTCELIGCMTSSFVDIMDASVGHTAELVDVEASWRAVKTHHVSFQQFRTSVWQAMNASSAFHDNFAHFIYTPGRTKGQKRTNPMFREAGDVLSTALALKQRGNHDDDGEPIKKSGWWCFSFKATATGAYAKKLPTKTAVYGVAIGFKLLSGGLFDFTKLLKGQVPTAVQTSVGFTIGYVPDSVGSTGLRAGVTVGGTITLGAFPIGVKFSVSLGLGASAATGNIHGGFCGGPTVIPRGSATPLFKCRGSVATAFTLFCKEFEFTTGQNDAASDDPCATKNRRYKYSDTRRRRRSGATDTDMTGTGRTSEDTADKCRERCNKVQGCKHYSYWNDGGCHLQGSTATPEKKRGAWAGPPVCCAYQNVEYKNRSGRRRMARMHSEKKTTETVMTDCQERCAKVSSCKHFTYWPNGGCWLTGWDSEAHHKVRGSIPVSGPPDCDD